MMIPSDRHEPAVQKEELGWLAFRYISAEMSPDEAEQFEGRLAIDQAAREAVAAEVHRSQVISCAFAAMPLANHTHNGCSTQRAAIQVAPNETRFQKLSTQRHKRNAAWIFAGVAACLAVLLITEFSPFHRADNPHLSGTPYLTDRSGMLSGSSSLASIWAESAFPVDRQDEPGRDEAVRDEPGRDELMRVADASPLDETSEFIVPEWLLAAVAVPTDPDQEQPEDLLYDN